jgi:hypothetical protein
LRFLISGIIISWYGLAAAGETSTTATRQVDLAIYPKKGFLGWPGGFAVCQTQIDLILR